ncbi:hypothetical protein [Isoptericola sp. NPDC019482]|uniref:hypothetical protein n=1 Tax=Isoptericola sp. NPDC019482 TaxID=3154688 RepID=UPI00349593EE
MTNNDAQGAAMVHVGNDMRDEFERAVEAQDGAALAALRGRLANCSDIMPGVLCDLLDLPPGATYAQGIESLAVRRESFVALADQYVDAPLDAQGDLAAQVVALRLGGDPMPMPQGLSDRLAASGARGLAFCGYQGGTGIFTYAQVARIIGRAHS